jgi:hypothetical protein
LVLGDDDAGEDLALVENLEALFVEALFERELVLFFVDRRALLLGFGFECASDLE